MRLTQSTIDEMIPDTPASRKGLRERWIVGIPALVIVLALCHLATSWNGLEPTPIGIRSHRIIHVVRAEHQPLPSTTGLVGELRATDDEQTFDPTAVPSPWPYGAGWR